MANNPTIKERLVTLETYGKVAKNDRKELHKKFDLMADDIKEIAKNGGMKRNDKISLSALVTFMTVGAAVAIYVLAEISGANF